MKTVYMQSYMSKGKAKAVWEEKKSDSILNFLFEESI